MGSKIFRLLLQAVNYSVFMALIWYFSLYPTYRHLDDNQAVLTLAFGHAAKRIAECATRSADELAELAPNMRMAIDCPRERSPLELEISLDDEPVTRLTIDAPGLYQDQGVDVYRDIITEAGRHHLSIWMNDDINIEGPTYRFDKTVNIEPMQRLVVSFDANSGGFSLQ
ncbi:MAG: hypothetical protein DHS20C01_09790 [marine bacterium B5-7]|nr:MAG: hypothetical protein DHS20C01_09790 [marine bacterium B5-7]